MDDKKSNWQRFQRLSFDSRTVARRARKAETATIRHARKFLARRLNNALDVRRHIVQWLIGVSLLIIAVGLQVVWIQHSYTKTVGVSGGTYAEATIGSVKSLNPLYASSSTETSVSRLVFSSLLQYDPTGHLSGDLAKKVAVDKSGKVYTVTLRNNIHWHDGTTLTANDVIFTLNLIRNPVVRSPLRNQWRDIPAEALDPTTVQFTLPSVYAAFPHALTFPVLPEHLLGSVEPSELRENAFSLSPVGSGPFQFKLLQTDGNQRIVNLIAFKDYFRGTPKIGRFEIHGFETPADITAALKSGQVNAAADLPSAPSLSSKQDYQLTTRSLNDGVYAFFNTSRPDLKDKTVRRALQEGLDVTALRKSLGDNTISLDLPFVAGQLDGVSLPTVPSYNQKTAEQLLSKDGWQQKGEFRYKKGKRLTLNVVTIKNSRYEIITAAMKKDWHALGVDVQVATVDLQDPAQDFRRNTLQPRAYDVLVYEISIGADPDVYAFWHSSQVGERGLNLSVYQNPIVDDALASARSRNEPELRDLKYQAFAKQWVSDVPAIGLYQSQLNYVANNQLSAIKPGQKLISSYDRYATVLYWTAARGSVYNTP